MHQHVSDEPSRPQHPTIPEAVYFFRSGLDPSLFKIGRSRNPAKRLAKLGEIIPGGVSLAHQINTNDGQWLETKLHRQFDAKRVNGEWFRLASHDFADMKAIARIDRAPAKPLQRPRGRPKGSRKKRWPPSRLHHTFSGQDRVIFRVAGKPMEIYIGPSNSPVTDQRYRDLIDCLDGVGFLSSSDERRLKIILAVRRCFGLGNSLTRERLGNL